MSNKEKKILYLFDEIGGIDDKYVSEAMAYESARPKKTRLTRVLLLAACITVIFAFCIIGIANVTSSLLEDGIGDAPNDFGDSPDSSGDSPSYDADNGLSSPDTLREVMTELDTVFLSAARVNEPAADLLCDGSVRIIWTYGNGVYYSLRLSDRDAQTLESRLANDRASSVSPTDNTYAEFRFYVSYGDGRVETPYLEDNSGRLSVGSLSDYLPEVYPSNELASFIGSLVGKAAS